MRSLLFVLPFVVLTFISWGLYGPVLHEGQHHLGDGVHPSSLRPFICVGIAYFLIAVVVPSDRPEGPRRKGELDRHGGRLVVPGRRGGALGALGIVLAFKFNGSPVYVMPLVFGLAPVVNTFVTMWMTQTFKEANSLFYAGVILVAVGTAGVLSFKPGHAPHPPVGAAAGADSAAAPACETARRTESGFGDGEAGADPVIHRAGGLVLGQLRADLAQGPNEDGRQPSAAVLVCRPGLLCDCRPSAVAARPVLP